MNSSNFVSIRFTSSVRLVFSLTQKVSIRSLGFVEKLKIKQFLYNLNQTGSSTTQKYVKVLRVALDVLNTRTLKKLKVRGVIQK